MWIYAKFLANTVGNYALNCLEFIKKNIMQKNSGIHTPPLK